MISAGVTAETLVDPRRAHQPIPRPISLTAQETSRESGSRESETPGATVVQPSAHVRERAFPDMCGRRASDSTELFQAAAV
jgi:hypothetical protein